MFFRSSSSCSSSARGRLHNYYLRKRRRWPFSPCNAKWLETLNQQQAMQILKQSASTTWTPTSTHLLSALIDSFTSYGCDPTPSAYHFVIQTLTRKPSQWGQISHVLDRLQNVEIFETPEYIFLYLMKFYGDIGMIRNAIELFFRIPKFRCTPTVHSLNSLLSVLCKKKGGLRLVPQILLESQLMNIRIEESSLRILIRALCRIKECTSAIELFNVMIKDGNSFDAEICSLILSTMCHVKHFTGIQVMNFFENVRKLGFCPGRIDWCNLIRFLVAKKKCTDALDALNRMKLNRIKPDTACYTTVLHGLILEGDYAKADELFDEMLVLGLVPDVCTYNVYVTGLCKQNKVQEGAKMLACMEELGCMPNLITYNTILGALCDSAELSKAKEVFREMRLKGLQLNSQTYGIIIDGLCRKGEIDEACNLLDEMVENCFIPQSSVVDAIICQLCHEGLVSRALELLNEMTDKNVVPGVKTWETILNGSTLSPSFEEMHLLIPHSI